MRITYSKDAQAVYVYINDLSVAETEVHDGVNVDYSGDGKVVGVEIFNVTEMPTIEDISDDDEDLDRCANGCVCTPEERAAAGEDTP